MKIAVTATGANLDAPTSPIFGRCPMYVFIDTDTMQFEYAGNPALSTPGGAGIQAAQYVVGRGVQAVVTGNVGPNAFQVLNAAGIPVYLFDGGTVRQAVEAFVAGQLPSVGRASAPQHAGMGRGLGRGPGGGGRRSGRRGGAGQGPPMPPAARDVDRENEIAALKAQADALRKQLSDVTEQIDRLEEEE